MRETTVKPKSLSRKVSFKEIRYRNQRPSITRTIDLDALTSKFSHLGPDVTSAISAQTKIYKELETLNGHHAERLASDEGVVLPEYTLLHGLSYNLELLRDIKNNGILAGEYYGHDDVTHGMADFWRMPKDTHIVDFIDRVKGCLHKKHGISKDVPLSKTPVTSMENGEIRTTTEEGQFLGLDRDGITFIIDPVAAKKIAGYDYFSDDKHPEALDKLVTDKDSASGYAKGRRSAILVGVPYSCFSAVIVGTKIVSDPEKLQSIIDLFGEDLMIISGDGQVLSVPLYAQDYANIDELNAGSSKRKDTLLDALPDSAISRVEKNPLMQWFFGQERIEQRIDEINNYLD